MIRDATANDATAITAIWNEVIADGAITFNPVEKLTTEVAKMIAARPAFIVASEAKNLLGFATFAQFRSGLGYARTMEHTVQLSPGARGHGIGRALMKELFLRAKAQRVHTLWAGVSGENPAGVAFHTALGFETIATLPEVGWKFERWIDLVLMQKRL